MGYRWMLLGFDEKTEQLAFERELPTMTVETMRRIFDLPPDDPVIGGSTAVGGTDRIAALGGHVQGIDRQRFDDFIEAIADQI